jgi:hypothetical protein
MDNPEKPAETSAAKTPSRRRRRRDYDVGYKKPPKDKQFKPGNSGNPAGRPKQQAGFSTLILKQFEKEIRVTENGQTRLVSALEAIAMQIVNRAAAGDMKAIVNVQKEIDAMERSQVLHRAARDETEIEPDPTDYDSLSEDELAMLYQKKVHGKP